MSKHLIEVEIPDGKYCLDFDKDISCRYQGDAYFGAGCCALVVEGDIIIHWEDEDKPWDKKEYKRIIKHPKCPSLLKKEVTKR